MTDLMVIEQQGLRVLTTAQLAECYGTNRKVISYNFNNNKNRYEEGKHYICISGDEKREFCNRLEIHDGSEKAANLYLWTERGALLHAKSLNTDKAWEVYGELVETYFRAKKAETALQNLSPQLQAMINLEIRQNNLESRISDIERRMNEAPAPEPEPEPEPQKPEPKKWSEREKDYLRKAYALGQTDVEIAADLDRTLDSVKNQRQKLGLTCKKIARWTKAEDKKLKQLRNKGLSCADIAVIIGRSYDGIHNRLCLLRRKGVKI